MPELLLRRYQKKTLPSTISGHKDLILVDPGQGTLEWGPQTGSIKIYTPFPEVEYEAIGAASRVFFQTGWAVKNVQFQDTSTAEGQVSPRTAEIDKSFTATNLIENEEDQLMELIVLVRTMLPVPYNNKLAERFITLFNDVKEEDPLSVGPSIESLRIFYNFLKLHSDLKMPSISLTPDNLIYASWRDQNKVFSVIFSKNEFVQFFVFEPDSTDASRNVRLSGSIAVEKLLEAVKSAGVLNWILDDRRSNS